MTVNTKKPNNADPQEVQELFSFLMSLEPSERFGIINELEKYLKKTNIFIPK